MMQQQLPELPNWLTAEIKLVYGGDYFRRGKSSVYSIQR